MQKIDFSNIDIKKGFWAEKQKMVRESTVYAVYKRFSETNRFDALKCRQNNKDYKPHIYWDSDVAKWIEGVAYLLEKESNDELEKIVDDAIDTIIENSDENGYFNSHFLTNRKDMRFKIRSEHELYCAGHLIEAAVAYYHSTGKDKFLKAMCKYADYIEKVFKTEKSAAFVTPGHPELELALVRLYEATGEKRYLELSKYFIDEHGKSDEMETFYDFVESTHNLDNTTIRDRSEAEGHCVRALYLFCGACDIARYYNDTELFEACQRVFEDIVKRKMYITGGVGSSYLGECFTASYDLPNREAYTETCAAIALAMFASRMQMIVPDSRYADTSERVIYNGFLSGVSMDGKAFFYENPLEIDPMLNNTNPSTKNKPRHPITQRQEVFGCSCCPPNVVRFIPSITNMMYTYDDETLYVHHYIDSVTRCDEIEITQDTKYPENGKIKISCKTNKNYIALRIPGWCKNYTINKDFEVKNGYAFVKLCNETEICIDFEMPVVFMRANKKVHENAGRVAVMRGPLVYCAEGVDNSEDVKNIRVDTASRPKLSKSQFLLPLIELDAYCDYETDELYVENMQEYEKIKLKLIPYYAFANRKETEMVVWLLKC